MKELTVFAHLALHSERITVAWRFPGTEEAPEMVQVALDRGLSWVTNLELADSLARGDFATRELIDASGAVQIEDQRLIAIGLDMYDAIFPDAVEQRWNQTFEIGTDRARNQVSIRVVFQWSASKKPQDSLDLSRIPFEALRCPNPGQLARVTNDFVLAPGISIERRITNYRGTGPSVSRLKKGAIILVFVGPINLDDPSRREEQKEADAVTLAIKNAGFGRGLCSIVSSEKQRATYESFCQKSRSCEVVHCIGHGKSELGFLFETEFGEADWVPLSRMAADLARTQVRLLILNGCETAVLSSLSCDFPAVIGNQYPITGTSVKRFETAFFERLLEHSNISEAVQAGRRSIAGGAPESRWEYRTPVLFLQNHRGGGGSNWLGCLCVCLLLLFAILSRPFLPYGDEQIETDVVVLVETVIEGTKQEGGAVPAAIAEKFRSMGYQVEIVEMDEEKSLEDSLERYQFKYLVKGQVSAHYEGGDTVEGTTQHRYVGQASLELVDAKTKKTLGSPREQDWRSAQSREVAAVDASVAAATQVSQAISRMLEEKDLPTD